MPKVNDVFCLKRGWMDNELFDDDAPYTKREAWCWLIEKMRWKEEVYYVGSTPHIIKRGEFCCSVRKMAEKWGWNKDAVIRYITRLETATMIRRRKIGNKTVISIVNYDKYQLEPGYSATNLRQNCDKLETQKNKGNKGNNTQDTSTSEYVDSLFGSEPQSSADIPDSQKYAFAGGTVKLLDRDWRKWVEEFYMIPPVELKTQLENIDKWWKDKTQSQKKQWFHRTKKMVEKEHKKRLERAPERMPGRLDSEYGTHSNHTLTAAEAKARRKEVMEALGVQDELI